MSCISGRVSANGLIIDVFVIDHPVFKSHLDKGKEVGSSAGSQAVEVEGLKQYKALVDTGATSSCISSGVASDLGLGPIGMKKMVSASGMTDKKEYLFCIGLPLVTSVDSVAGTAQGALHVFEPPIRGLEFNAGNRI